MWITTKVTDGYKEITNTGTGVIRRVPFASDKQWEYLESLRKQAGKPQRLQNRPLMYKATRQIEKLLDKLKKDQTTLL